MRLDRADLHVRSVSICSTYVCAHEKTRFKSQIFEKELNAAYETTAISEQIVFISSDTLFWLLHNPIFVTWVSEA